MIPDMPDPAPFAFTYRNWRGEIGERRAIPIGVWFSSTEWHPEPQWLLRAYDCDKRETRDFAMRDIGAMQAAMPAPAGVSFQDRVQPWMMACFGPEISADKLERGDRLLEEVLELLQSVGYPRERIASLSSYVWSRPKGEPAQEVGGSMVTLAAFCLAHDLDMHAAGETELARIWTKVEAIRAKQAAKPTGSALPVAVEPTPAPAPAAQSVEDQGWRPASEAPTGTWLITHRRGEKGSAVSLRMAEQDGSPSDEWCAPDGRTTITHHSYPPPTHYFQPPPLPSRAGQAPDAPHGWVCWNEGPGGWFWFPTREQCEHELSDDIRPATAAEKALFGALGGKLCPDDLCPICFKPLEPDDTCATDISEGICHAACLEGSPVVDLETGEETGGRADTYRYGDDATRESGG